MTILFAGYQKSGKTSLGREMASHYGYSFCDTDDLLLASFAQPYSTLREAYRALGESVFRAREQAVLASLQPNEKTFIALGGGSLDCQDNIRLCRKLGSIVFLNWHPDVLAARIGDQPRDYRQNRTFKAHWEMRQARYQSCADYQCDFGACDWPDAISRLSQLMESIHA